MKKHLKKLKQEIFTGGRTIALLGAFFLAISAFLTWGYTENVSVTGLSGDGIITVSLGIVAFLFLFIKHIHLWITLLFGLTGVAIGTIDFMAMAKATAELSGNVGVGLYITLIASLGIVFGIIVEMIEEKQRKLNLYYIDEDQ